MWRCRIDPSFLKPNDLLGFVIGRCSFPTEGETFEDHFIAWTNSQGGTHYTHTNSQSKFGAALNTIHEEQTYLLCHPTNFQLGRALFYFFNLSPLVESIVSQILRPFVWR